MSLPPIIFGMGATKAGTSWLWEALAAHPSVSARKIKELHSFDTFDAKDQTRQLDGFARVRGKMTDRARIADMEALCAVLAGDRAGDDGYKDYVAGPGVALDVTPSYGLLSVEGLKRMLAAFPAARFLYLVRDPVERLWSHIRMEVSRRMQPGADFDNRARGMLRRIADEGAEPQITKRGDYAGAIARLCEAVPEAQLRVLVSEEMTVATVCEAAGLPMHETGVKAAHVGQPSEMKEGMHARAARFLKDQYQFMADYLGRIPAAWQANHERAFA